jgi:hypothetical protein
LDCELSKQLFLICEELGTDGGSGNLEELFLELLLIHRGFDSNPLQLVQGAVLRVSESFYN